MIIFVVFNLVSNSVVEARKGTSDPILSGLKSFSAFFSRTRAFFFADRIAIKRKTRKSVVFYFAKRFDRNAITRNDKIMRLLFDRRNRRGIVTFSIRLSTCFAFFFFSFCVLIDAHRLWRKTIHRCEFLFIFFFRFSSGSQMVYVLFFKIYCLCKYFTSFCVCPQYIVYVIGFFFW